MDSQDRTEFRALLLARRDDLRGRLDAHQGAESMIEHARTVLLQDDDDAPQRDSDREVDQAVGDLARVELRQIDDALARLDAGQYGDCAACGDPIPLARLRIEPHALRCVACESMRDKAHGGVRVPRL